MTSRNPRLPARTAAALAAALIAAAALAATTAAPAPAATTSTAQATLSLDGPAYRQAHRAGLRAGATGGATLRSSALRLPVTATVVDSGAAAGLKGTIVLRAGKRSTTVSRLRVTVRSTRKVTVTGTLAGRALTVLTGTAPKKGFALDRTAGTVAFGGTAVSLGPAAAKAVRTRLKLRRSPTGHLGTLTLTAGPLGGGTTTPGTSTPGTTPTPGTSTPDTPSTDPGGPPIVSGPITDETPPLTRPTGAVDVTAATVRWRVRDSWVQYIAGGNPSGTGTTASGGAAGDPALQQGCSSDGSVNTAQLTYQFRFPFSAGWYDPATGRASLSFAGAVTFRYPSHGIDLTTSSPEVQLDGSASKLVFAFGGSGGTNLGDKRSVLTELQVAQPPVPKACASDTAPGQSANPVVSGTTHTYERIPGVIPAGTGSSVFAGFYAPGAPFGWLTVSFTTAS